MTLQSPGRNTAVSAFPTSDQICAAAMKCFALHGVEAGSLRMVAKTAGVSLGLVQHRFGSKAALVTAVDDRLMAIIADTSPSCTPGPNPAAEMSRRATLLIAQHPDAIDYLARLLLDDKATGRAIFDRLLAIGSAQCGHLRATQQPGDRAWDALHPLIHILGILILRTHIERQLPQSLTAPEQRHNLQSALDQLVERGGWIRAAKDAGRSDSAEPTF